MISNKWLLFGFLFFSYQDDARSNTHQLYRLDAHIASRRQFFISKNAESNIKQATISSKLFQILSISGKRDTDQKSIHGKIVSK